MSKPTFQPAAPPQSTSKGKKTGQLTSRDFNPLRGKVFFLDLPGHKCLNAIECKLIERGATIEKFFHRGVRYLVTNRHKTAKKMGLSCMTPSPDTPESGVGGNGNFGVPSPFSNSSDSVKAKSVPVAHGTRAAKMLAASVSEM